MSNSLAIVLLAGILIAAWLWFRRSGPSRGDEAQLRRICRGSDEQAERLIAGEMSRAPGISRAEAASRAVERYQRDNR